MKNKDKKDSPGISTRAVHAGEERKKYADSLITPIVQTSTFVFHNTKDIRDYTSKKKVRYEYGRYGNPTQRAVEMKLAQLEGAEDCQLFSSGMAAITTTLLALLANGQHIIITDDLYKKTLHLCRDELPRLGISCSIVRVGDYPGLKQAINDRTALIFTESPTNPYLYVLDLKRLVRISRKAGIMFLLDSTLATPFNQRPLEFGVDLVIHSATKYLSGHNDILAGAVLGSKKLIAKIRDLHKTVGGMIEPHCCYLLLRGLKTFPLRMERHNQNAERIAAFLESHPQVNRVYYPGRKTHPQHRLAREQMDGFGGVVSFEIKGGLRAANRFLNKLRLCYIAPSFGGVETLISHPASITYYDLSREKRLEIGIKDELIRLAVGIEDSEDIIADLKKALKAS
jgi:cystathionine gamma-synthase